MLTQSSRKIGYSFAGKIISVWLIFFLALGTTPPAHGEVNVSSPHLFEGGQDLIRQIALPEGLGRIEDIFIAPSVPHKNARILVYIKDAHANYEAQTHIRDILRVLSRDYGFQLIAAEGAVSKLDRAQLNFYSDANTNLKIADFLAQKGEISGVDLFVLENERISAYGIENQDAYAENLKAFRSVMNAGRERGMFLKAVSGQTDLVIAKLNNKKLRALIRSWQKLSDHSADISTYVTQIAKAAKGSLGIDLSDIAGQLDWPALARIVRLKETELKLNAKAIESEQAKILEILEGIQAGSLAKDLERIGVTQRPAAGNEEPRTGKVIAQPRLLYEKIFDLASPKGFLFSDFPEYGTYAQFLILQSEIDSQKLFTEVEELSARLFEVLAKSPEEKELVRFIKDLHLLGKTLSLELVRDDLENFSGRQEDLRPARMEARLRALKENASVLNHKADLVTAAAGLDPVFGEAMRFYEGARSREKYLVENTLRRMGGNGTDKAVLVTGGFHTEGIKERLAEEGVSYVVIAPSFKVSEGGSEYLNVMLNRREEKLSLSLISAPDKLDPEIFYLNDREPLQLTVREANGAERVLYLPQRPQAAAGKQAAEAAPTELAKAASLGTESLIPRSDILRILEGLLEEPLDLEMLAQTANRIVESSSIARAADVSELLAERTPEDLREELSRAVAEADKKVRESLPAERTAYEKMLSPSKLDLGRLAESLSGAVPAGARRGMLLPPVRKELLTAADLGNIRPGIEGSPADFGALADVLGRLVANVPPSDGDLNALLFSRVPEPLIPDFVELLREAVARLGELPAGKRADEERKIPEGLDLEEFLQKYEMTPPARPPVPGAGKLTGPGIVGMMRAGIRARDLDLAGLKQGLDILLLGHEAFAMDIYELVISRIPEGSEVDVLEVVSEAEERLSRLEVNERQALEKSVIPEGLDLGRLAESIRVKLTPQSVYRAAIRVGPVEPAALKLAASLGQTPSEFIATRTPAELRSELAGMLTAVAQQVGTYGRGNRVFWLSGSSDWIGLYEVDLPDLITKLASPISVSAEVEEAGNIGRADLAAIRQGIEAKPRMDLSSLREVIARVMRTSQVFQYLPMGRSELLDSLAALQGSSEVINQQRSVIALRLSSPETWALDIEAMNGVVNGLVEALGRIEGTSKDAFETMASIAGAMANISEAVFFTPALAEAVPVLLEILKGRIPGESKEAKMARYQIGSAVSSILARGEFPDEGKLYSIVNLILGQLNGIEGSTIEAIEQRGALVMGLLGLKAGSKQIYPEKELEIYRALAAAWERTEGASVSAESLRESVLLGIGERLQSIPVSELQKIRAFALKGLEQAQTLPEELMQGRLQAVGNIMAVLLPRMAGFKAEIPENAPIFKAMRQLFNFAFFAKDFDKFGEAMREAETILAQADRENVAANITAMGHRIFASSLGQNLVEFIVTRTPVELRPRLAGMLTGLKQQAFFWEPLGGTSVLLQNNTWVDLGVINLPELIDALAAPIPEDLQAEEAGNIGREDLEAIRSGFANDWNANSLKGILERVQRTSPVFRVHAMGRKELLAELGSLQGSSDETNRLRSAIALSFIRGETWVMNKKIMNGIVSALIGSLTEIRGESSAAIEARGSIAYALSRIAVAKLFAPELVNAVAPLMDTLMTGVPGESAEAERTRAKIGSAVRNIVWQGVFPEKTRLYEILSLLLADLNQIAGTAAEALQQRSAIANALMGFRSRTISRERLGEMMNVLANAWDRTEGSSEWANETRIGILDVMTFMAYKVGKNDLPAIRSLALKGVELAKREGGEVLSPQLLEAAGILQNALEERSGIPGASLGQELPAVEIQASVETVPSVMAPVTETPTPVAGQAVSPGKLPELVSNAVNNLAAIQALLADLAEQLKPLVPAMETGPATAEQIGPLQRSVAGLIGKVGEVAVAVEEIGQVEGLAPETREQVVGIQESLESAVLSPVMGFAPGPMPAEFVRRQVEDFVGNFNGLVPGLNQVKPVLSSLSSEFPKLKLPEFINVPEIRTIPYPGSAAPFLESVREFQPILQYLEASLRQDGVSLVSVLEVTGLAGGFVEMGFPREVTAALLDLLYPKLRIGERLYTQGYLTARQAKLKEAVHDVFDVYFQVDTVNAGAEILIFGDRLPTEEEILALQLSLQMKTKLYARVVVYEGMVDPENVMAMMERVRAKLDFSDLHYPIGDRFDILFTNRANVAEFVKELAMRRLPGRERTLYESIRRIASEKIVTPLDLYRHLVIMGPQELVPDILLQEEAWKVYPSHPIGSKSFRKIAPYFLGLKLSQAALTRDQIPDEDKAEFKVQSPGLFNFVPNPNALAQFLNTWIRNVRKMLAAA